MIDPLSLMRKVDEEIGELFLLEQEPTPEQLQAAIRRRTLTRQFVPVFVGSALKNTGIQPLLDGIVSTLPSPLDVSNHALDLTRAEEKVPLSCEDLSLPFVGLAFKIDRGQFGQLTYIRTYQGVCVCECV